MSRRAHLCAPDAAGGPAALARRRGRSEHADRALDRALGDDRPGDRELDRHALDDAADEGAPLVDHPPRHARRARRARCARSSRTSSTRRCRSSSTSHPTAPAPPRPAPSSPRPPTSPRWRRRPTSARPARSPSTGEDIGGTLGEKIENDAAAFIRALAESHGRNGAVAETDGHRGRELHRRARRSSGR